MENKTLLDRLYVKGLFGTFNYDIVRQQGSPLTIITGPNGFGKTTLLRSIVSVFRFSFSYFLTFPFDEMLFEMERDGVRIKLVMKQTHTQQRQVQGDILLSNNVDGLTIILDAGEIHSEQTRTMQEVESLLETQGYVRYLDEWKKGGDRYSLGRVFAQEDMLEGMLFDQIPIADVIGEEHVVYKADDRREDFEKTLNEMARLMSDNRELFSKAVTDNFAYLLQTKQTNNVLSETELSRCKDIVQRIKRYGLCSVDLTVIPNLESVYDILGSQINELSDDVLTPLQQYEKAIGDKEFENKHMVIDHDGIRFYSNDKDGLINSESLSSGEKQVVALYYDLCFEKSVSMIIVDEPETSWHVSWQVDFLEEMKELAAKKNCQVLVATHSPYIINKCMDLVSDLYEQSVR